VCASHIHILLINFISIRSKCIYTFLFDCNRLGALFNGSYISTTIVFGVYAVYLIFVCTGDYCLGEKCDSEIDRIVALPTDNENEKLTDDPTTQW
jgi:hypothetical protein